MGEELTGASAQFIAVLCFAGLCWLAHRFIARWRKRSHQSFRTWLGLYTGTSTLKERVLFILGLAVLNVFMSLIEAMLGWRELLSELMRNVPVAELAQIEPPGAALIAGLAYATVRTAGSEELLIRGLLYKRLVAWWGYHLANISQALLFTLVHNGIIQLAMPEAPLWLHADIFLRVFAASWLIGWFMERRDGGSLVMPWLAHSLANLITFLSFFIA